MAVKRLLTTVIISTEFVGFHRWPDAPEHVSYLSSLHRHVFKVKIGVKVTHDNRDVEFITLKETVDYWIRENTFPQHFSCEMMCDAIAEFLSNEFDVAFVEVSEDGENGAISIYERVDSQQDNASGSDQDSKPSTG